jgi:hypothetical protein
VKQAKVAVMRELPKRSAAARISYIGDEGPVFETI